jgi:mono/diheme cytochrome c family protein
LKPFLALTLLILPAVAAGPAASEETQALTTHAATAVTAPAAPAPSVPAAGAVERGRYLVEHVAMCGQCHTPRDDRGILQTSRWLHGGPVPVPTPHGFTQWAYKAPRLAGLPQHTDSQFVTLMTTGVNRDGKTPMLPMPPFRLSEADALAVAAYLRSVP